METATKAFLTDSFATCLVSASFSVQKLGHREVEKKGGNAGNRAHCWNLTWWMGMMLMMCGTVLHLILLPYADMTLLSANSSIAILANLFLSMWLFNEKFIMRYDLPALILIIGGTLCIILLANKQQEKYEGQALIDLIGETKAIIFFIIVGLFIIITHCVVYLFRKSLRNFETDADEYDQKARQENCDNKLLVFPDQKEEEKSETEAKAEIETEDETVELIDQHRPYRIII